MANLYIDIALQLQRQITSGELADGQRLMSERTLAEQFGVSRNVIREALCVLSEKGLIQIQPGKGAFVIPSHQKTMEDIVAAALNNNSLRWNDIVEAREVIELAAVKNAAKRASKEDIWRLNEIYTQMSRSMENSIGYNIMFAELDAEFHMTIAKISGNQMFEMLLNVFYNIFDSKQMFWISQLYPESIVRTQQGHLNILQAIIEGDSEKACEMLSQHLASLRAKISALQEYNPRQSLPEEISKIQTQNSGSHTSK